MRYQLVSPPVGGLWSAVHRLDAAMELVQRALADAGDIDSQRVIAERQAALEARERTVQERIEALQGVADAAGRAISESAADRAALWAAVNALVSDVQGILASLQGHDHTQITEALAHLSEANEALGVRVEVAEEKASSAHTAASAATQAAMVARSTAEQAAGVAAEAGTAATLASQAASQAGVAAQAATSTAQAAAGSAQAAAGTAQSAATDAATAKTAAASATQTAASAASTANAASTIASSAQSTATEAKTAAEGAQAAVTALATRVSALEARTVTARQVASALPVIIAGNGVDVTITWPTPLPSATYQLVLTPGPALIGKAVLTAKAGTQTASGVVVRVQASLAIAVGASFEALAIWQG